MKDRVFSGADVDEALAVAGATLGLPLAGLRYVVLEAGTPGGRGLKPTPARIAVLIKEARAREAAPTSETAPVLEAGDVRAGLRALVRALAEAGGLEIDSEIEETNEALVLHLQGRDYAFFQGEDGRGEELLALEHLCQRIYGRALEPLALRVRCEGFRERRDEALAREARLLAEAVRADGESREMEPLNAYERRIVHLALQDEPGVTTFSLGEGRARRVTVAPKTREPGGPTAGSEDGEPR